MRRELLNGKGFLLFKKGIPVAEWGNLKSAVAYFGLGVHIGYPISQNVGLLSSLLPFPLNSQGLCRMPSDRSHFRVSQGMYN